MKKTLPFLLLLLTLIGYGQSPVYQFNFDGNVNNSGTGLVNSPFTATSGSFQYGADRNGNANSAIFATPFNNGAVCPNLPSGTAERTISCWVRLFPDTNNGGYRITRIIGYGTNAANQAFGFDFPNNSNVSYYVWGSNDQSVNIINNQSNGWVHLTMSYNGTTIKRYINGILFNTANVTLNTNTATSGNRLSLGKYANEVVFNPVDCLIDDFRVYNVALTDSQVTSLFNTGNTGSSPSIPIVSNVTATNITSTSATINYSINANNAPTNTEVRFAVTPGGSLQIQSGPSASGSTPTPLSQNLTGLLPNTTYEYAVWATNSQGTVFSTAATFTTPNGGLVPTIGSTNFTSSTSNSASIAIVVNPGGLSTSTSISVTPVGGTTFTVAGPTFTGTGNQNFNFTIPSLQSNTCYTYQIVAANSAGSSLPSSTIAFCTLDVNNNKTPFYHFQFNGNTQEKNNPSISFQNPNSGFVDNNTAIRLNNNVQSIVLPFLPQGSARRTISMRILFESGALATDNNVFSYGNATSNGQSYGYTQNSTSTTFYTWGGLGFDSTFSNPLNFGTYYTMVFVYDSGVTRVYKDGTLIQTITIPANTIGTTFRIGRTTTGVGGFFNGRVDDLRIYNEALTASEVVTLNSLIQATTAPAITNLTASNVTFNSAQINFNLNAFGSATNYVVEYTTDVLGTWQIQNGGTTSVNTSTPFQVTLNNLTPNETYFVRVRATNAASQITLTPEIQFNTAPAIVLTNLNESNVTTTSAQINYTLNTNGFNAFIEIRYQAGNVFDSDAPFTTVTVNSSLTNNTATNYNFTLSGLNPNTTYSYQFGIASSVGSVEVQENAAFTTLGISAQPTAPSPQTFCQTSNPTIANLSATGTNIKWYANATDGTQLANSTALVQGTYYVSQTQGNNAESSRLAVQVNITVTSPPANVPANQVFCQSATLGNIQTGAGSNFQWYAAQTGGTALPNSTAITTGTYFLSQTIANCESARTAVSVTVNVVNAPTGSANQSFVQGATTSNLVANGTNINWFASQTDALLNQNPLPFTTVLVNNATYYAMQTINGCRSNSALPVTVTITLSTVDQDKLLFSMYPNPTSQNVMIETQSEIKIIEVYSIHGQKMFSSDEKLLKISNLSGGMYLIKVEDVNGLVGIKKLIKK